MQLLYRFFITSKGLSVLTALVLCATDLKAQQKDAALWMEMEVEKDLGNDWSISFDEELRFDENVSELGRVYTGAGLEKGFWQDLKAGVSYGWIMKRRVDDFYSNRHRIQFDLSYKYKFNRLSISLRQRYLLQYNDVESSTDGSVPEHVLRTKFSANYKLNKKWSGSVAAELYFLDTQYYGWMFVNGRYQAGIEYSFNKSHAVELRYIIDKEVNIKDPLTTYAIGIGYKYNLPESKKEQPKAP